THPSLVLSTMTFEPLGSEAQVTGQLLRETWGSGVSLLPDDTLATFRQQITDEVPETNILLQPGRNRLVSQILQGENPEVILGEIVLFEPGPDWFAKNKVREPILL